MLTGSDCEFQPAQRPLAVAAARKSQDVPDDWDAEDVEDEEPQKLWETA